MNRYLLIIVIVTATSACSGVDEPVRTYRMGFMNSAPRFNDFALAFQSLELWTQRADAAIISTEVPWDSLLDGKDVKAHVLYNYYNLANYYRSKNLKLWVYIDPENGLDRAHDAVALQQAGRSIADADMQALYKRFVIVMDSILKPEHLGLALETNLIRGSATPSIYNGMRQAVNEVAVELKDRNSKAKLSVSVQVEYAWGKLGGGPFRGIRQDFDDFPFVEELGLSSYPYFGYDDPSEIPADYYSKLVEGKSLPVFVSEGGWASASISTPGISFSSSPEKQKQYVIHHRKLLDHVKAIALFQLTFTDIDVSSLPPSLPESIVYFTSLGLVDVNLMPKPGLDAWDATFRYKLTAK